MFTCGRNFRNAPSSPLKPSFTLPTPPPTRKFFLFCFILFLNSQQEHKFSVMHFTIVSDIFIYLQTIYCVLMVYTVQTNQTTLTAFFIQTDSPWTVLETGLNQSCFLLSRNFV
jgi:hypothetical protein